MDNYYVDFFLYCTRLVNGFEPNKLLELDFCPPTRVLHPPLAIRIKS